MLNCSHIRMQKRKQWSVKQSFVGNRLWESEMHLARTVQTKKPHIIEDVWLFYEGSYEGYPQKNHLSC